MLALIAAACRPPCGACSSFLCLEARPWRPHAAQAQLRHVLSPLDALQYGTARTVVPPRGASLQPLAALTVVPPLPVQDLDALQNGTASSVGKLLGYDVLGDMDQVITVSVMPGGGGTRQLSVTQVRELTWEEHLKLWKVGLQRVRGPELWHAGAGVGWECAPAQGQC